MILFNYKPWRGVILFMPFLAACTQIPTIEKSEVKFSTLAVPQPDSLICLNKATGQIKAKELVHVTKRVVVIAGGKNAMSDEDWEKYNPSFPWRKNIDRYTLFSQSCFLRSPNAPVDCKGTDCRTIQTFKGHTWLELANFVAVDFIPEGGTSSDPQTPDPGELSIKVVSKCHVLTFEGEIYDLSDGLGNHFVMHATENSAPSLEVALPPGWVLKRDTLATPLVVGPRGIEGECYHVLISDHFGQGYHQYQFADPIFPSK